MVNLLDLPTDITLQIFGHFERPPAIQKHGAYRSFNQPGFDGLVTLQACRLTCRGLNELVSGMLCPLFRGKLDKKTVDRIENLSRNPLIAQGVRVVEINLAFRPKSIAGDLSRYCEFVTDKIDSFINSCHYHTEFLNYEDEDESPEALEYRGYMAASEKLYLIRESWRQCVEPGKEAHRTADASYQQLLKECFATYSLEQREAMEMINDGSFVNIIASAISRCEHLSLLSFVDGGGGLSREPMEVANDRNRLAQEMLQPHSWLKVEDLQIEPDLSPAQLLVELPIACDQLRTPLKGLDIGCFPLKRSFSSLIPPGDSTTTWSNLAAACRSLKTFQLGNNGMNHTPYRQERIAAGNCDIIDAYFGAVCSGPELASVYFSMTPFRVCGSNRSGRDREAADLHYQAGPILRRLNSPSLTYFEVLNVEMSGPDLELLIERLPRFTLKYIRLCGVDLDKGEFANAMEILCSRKEDSKDCVIDLSSLQGGEFGDPKGFDDSGWPFGDEDGDSFWARLDEHQRPSLLQRTMEYVCGVSQVNPLLKSNGNA